MNTDIDIFKVLEENGFNIKQIVEKLNDRDSMIEQLLEKIEKLKKEQGDYEESKKPTKPGKESKE